MEVFVKGIKVTLTDEQTAFVKKELARIRKTKSGFRKVLESYGFKNTKEGFIHPEQNWYADIQYAGKFSQVWMVGDGLRCNGFPGGSSYSEPEEIASELDNALEKLENGQNAQK